MKSLATNLLKVWVLVVLLSACNKGNRFPPCFKLMAVYLNKTADPDCPPAVFRIEESPDPSVATGELAMITTGSNYLEYLRTGRVIYIKTIEQPKVVNNGGACSEKYRYNLVGSLCRDGARQ